MKNILITGGAGFIGSHLALKLNSLGYIVTVLDNLSPQIHGIKPVETSPLYQTIIGKVNFIKGTVISKKDWLKAIEGQDAIIHLAAETGTGQSMYEIEKYVGVNVGGTALMLDILTNVKHDIRKIIVASSRAIYGEGKYECIEHGIVYPEGRGDDDLRKSNFECKCPHCGGLIKPLATDENALIHPSSIYGITKQTQEQMVITTGKSLGIPAVAFRYQNVYGPGQSLSNPYTGILSIFSTQINNGNSLNIYEDGKESRDFVYIDDVVEATILGLEKERANNNVFNVGSNERIDVYSVAKLLKQKFNSSVDINITANYRLGDIRHNMADLSKTEKELGYKPSIPFIHGINFFCDWVNSQDVKTDNYLQSIIEMKEKRIMK